MQQQVYRRFGQLSSMSINKLELEMKNTEQSCAGSGNDPFAVQHIPGEFLALNHSLRDSWTP